MTILSEYIRNMDAFMCMIKHCKANIFEILLYPIQIIGVACFGIGCFTSKTCLKDYELQKENTYSLCSIKITTVDSIRREGLFC